ncbi:MAG: carboxypeptidase regulatory-like domain-containing protein [Planctomycetota bacterium]
MAVLLVGAVLLRALQPEDPPKPLGVAEPDDPAAGDAQGPSLEGSSAPTGIATARAVAPQAHDVDRPGSIAGRVLEPDGTPVPGLTVRLLRGTSPTRGDAPEHPLAPRTDAEGRYRFDGVWPGPCQLRVGRGARDDEGVAREFVLAAGEALEGIDLEIPQGLRLRGRVVDVHGAHYGPARLRFRRRDGPGTDVPFILPAGGAFEVRVRQPGTYEGWAAGGVRLEGTVEAGGEAAELIFDPANRQDVVVHIVDPEGVPVPRAKLSVMHGGGDGSYDGKTVEVEAGMHRIPRGALERYLQLTVTEPRSAEGEPLPFCGEMIEVAASEATEIRIQLRPAAEIRGTVLGPADEPVAGMVVTAQPWVVGTTAETGGAAQSDEQGRFVLPALPPGLTLLRIRDRSRRWRLADAVEVHAPQEDLVLRVEEATRIEVVVVDADRKPLPGVRVVARSANARWTSVHGKTDAEGRVELAGFFDGELIDVNANEMSGLAEGGWSEGPVRARAPGRVEIVRSGTVTLRGTVVDEDGKPVGLAPVTVRSVGPGGAQSLASSEPVTGTFEVAHLKPGRARVWIGYGRDNHLPTEPIDIELPSDDVRLVLRKTVGVRGRLLVSDPHAWQIIWPVEMGGGVGQIDEEGRFHIPHARGPRGALLARPRDIRDARIAILEDIDPTAGPFDLVEQPAGTIAGRIRGWQAGTVRADYLTLIAERPPLHVVAEPVADDGSFVIRGLPPGLWTLRASTPHGTTELAGVATGSVGIRLEMPSMGPDVEAAPR